ncbi:hypothetical protein SAMN04487944_10246 [Gracilibacillus ureilyticus]|uniref:Uncharacterized protein n=1 Tax=Gracilibacillus ureilyticus TaxID=531814 RepID=A0A1H9MLG1_9BACI|nr:hypothetical protein [Gracilibacillus ureilyticus]SER24532.1 hypothetical protein SAMN04487944_10246 [Gracilibacillus ureilyticus]
MQQESRSELHQQLSQTKQNLIKLQENYRNYQALLPEVKLLKWWQHIIVWFILFFGVAYLIDIVTYPFRSLFNVGEPSDFLVYLLMAIFTIFYIMGYTKYGRYKEKKAQEKLEKQTTVLQRLEAEKEQLLQLLDYSIVPEKYWTVHAIQMFEEYIQNSRADSLKEAINLYEQELRHEEHMQEMRHLKQLQAATYQKAQEASTLGWINFFTRR